MKEMATLMRRAHDNMSRSMHTCMPGTILSYDASSQMASVQPSLNRQQPDGREEKMPVVNNVPVVWPRSGGASMTFPVKPGDGCLLLFAERSLDEWKSSGGEVTPRDARRADLSDAVALMGFVHFGGGGGPSDAVEIKMGGSTVTMKDGEVTMDAPTVNIKAPSTNIEGNVSVTGNFTVQGGGGGAVNITSGTLLHNGVNIGNTHKHSGITPGGGNTGNPI